MNDKDNPKKDEFPELDPNCLVRVNRGEEFFGYKDTQRDKLIKDGVLPRPFPLRPGGRAKAWTGAQINAYRRKVFAQPPSPVGEEPAPKTKSKKK